jgi:hypothetical protein
MKVLPDVLAIMLVVVFLLPYYIATIKKTTNDNN